jgi:hypothetical protein
MESMILDAMKEVERLHALGQEKPLTETLSYDYDGKPHTYIHGVNVGTNGRTLGDAVQPFRPAKLDVSTLTGFIDAIKAGVIGDAAGKLVHVEDYLTVSVKRALCDPFGKRDTLLTAKHTPLDAFKFGRYYEDPQEFVIAFQVGFHLNDPDGAYLLKLASNLNSISSIGTTDDGINQTIVVKQGEIKTAEVNLKPRLKLIPKTTFDEAAAVEREFLLRVQPSRLGAPSLALFAVDGTKWQGDAMQAIKAYLHKHLTDWAILA